MNRTTGVALSALSILGLVAAGCTTSNDTADNTPPTTIVVPAAAAPRTATVASSEKGALPAQTSSTNAGPGGATGAQSAVADAIDTAIVRNTQMTGSRVTAVVDSSGVATLTGFVQNGQQKALAEKAAHDTTGVSSIKDKLEIRPTGGAGKSSPVNVVTSIGSAPDPAPAPAASPTPGVVVVNNYVPVPQAQSSPSVNINVTPPNNNGGDNSNGNNGNGGTNNYYDDGTSAYYGNGYGNGSYSDGGNGDTAYSRNPAVMNSPVVPDSLRNLALSRDYALARYPAPYGYGGAESLPIPAGTYGYPSSYGSNGGYPIDFYAYGR